MLLCFFFFPSRHLSVCCLEYEQHIYNPQHRFYCSAVYVVLTARYSYAFLLPTSQIIGSLQWNLSFIYSATKTYVYVAHYEMIYVFCLLLWSWQAHDGTVLSCSVLFLLLFYIGLQNWFLYIVFTPLSSRELF